MKVFITGHDGFTGKYLTRQLDQSGIDWMGLRCNILDASQVIKEIKNYQPTIVFHLAGLAVTHNTKIENQYLINTIGTLNLLEAIKNNVKTVEKIFIVSTGTVYKPNNDVSGYSEDSSLGPITHYGNSKYCAELLVKLYIDLNITILRPFNYSGVGQTDNYILPKLIKSYKNDKDQIKLGNIDVEREFNDVRWVIDIYVNLIKKSPEQKYINICSGVPISISKIIEILKIISGRNIKIIQDKNLIRKNEPKIFIGNPSTLKSIYNCTNIENNLEKLIIWMYGNNK